MIAYLITQRGKTYIVDDNCIQIDEHKARGDGDKWFYDIYSDDDGVVRIFDPVEVGMDKEDAN